MMKKKLGLRLMTGGLCVAPALILASQPWSHADPQKWTPADVQRILLASPWAQQAGVTFGIKFDDDTPGPAPMPGAKEAGLANGQDLNSGRWDGGVGRPDKYQVPTLNVLVRWDSALPERLASAQAKKQNSNATSFTDAQVRQYYIITVIGLVPGGRYNQAAHTESQSSSDDTVDTRNPEQMLEQLMAYSRLITRSGAIRAADAKLDAASGELHLFFPREHAIQESDKEVALETRFGSVSLTKKFRLKDMTYGGKLEL